MIFQLVIAMLVAQSCLTFCDPHGLGCQAPLSMECSRQEYWSGLPFPSPGDLPDPGIEPRPPALQADLNHLSHQGSPIRKAFIFVSFLLLTHVPGLCCWGLDQKLVAKVMMEVGWVRVLFPWAQARQASRTILWTYTDPSSQHFAPS